MGEIKAVPKLVEAFQTARNVERVEQAAVGVLKETKFAVIEEKLIVAETANGLRESETAAKQAVEAEKNIGKIEKFGQRLDYSKTFARDVADNFKVGSKIFNGKLEEDLVLVQYHADVKLGAQRSAKYWTPVSQANEFKTMDDVTRKLALVPEWGERTVVSVARIPKGTEVIYCVGRAQPQLSETAGEFIGDGTQYLFKNFDPSWIAETRKILK